MTVAKDGPKAIHGGITYVSETTNSITIRIAANSVPNTQNNIPILIQMNPRTIDNNTTFEKVFTELSSEWGKLYVKDAGNNQNLYTDYWNDIEKFARVWVVLTELTTAQKDIIIEFNILDPINSLNKWIGVNIET